MINNATFIQWQNKQQLIKNDAQLDLYQRYLGTIEQLVDSKETLLDFVAKSSHYHKYRTEEMLYIYSQNQEATQVADYDSWIKIGRQVTAGQRSMRIMLYNEQKESIYYRHLFDISQTTGKELTIQEKAYHYDGRQELFNQLELDHLSQLQALRKLVTESTERVYVDNEKAYLNDSFVLAELMLAERLGVPYELNEYKDSLQYVTDTSIYEQELTFPLFDILDVTKQITQDVLQRFKEVEQIIQQEDKEHGQSLNERRVSERVSDERTTGREVRETVYQDDSRASADRVRELAADGSTINTGEGVPGQHGGENAPEIFTTARETTDEGYLEHNTESATLEQPEITSGGSDSVRKSSESLTSGLFSVAEVMEDLQMEGNLVSLGEGHYQHNVDTNESNLVLNLEVFTYDGSTPEQLETTPNYWTLALLDKDTQDLIGYVAFGEEWAQDFPVGTDLELLNDAYRDAIPLESHLLLAIELADWLDDRQEQRLTMSAPVQETPLLESEPITKTQPEAVEEKVLENPLLPDGKSFRYQVIQDVMKTGSGVQNGKFRLAQLVHQGLARADLVKAVKEEYGEGGCSHAIPYARVGMRYGPKGLTLDHNEVEQTLKWPVVVDHISYLVNQGEYFTPEELEKYNDWSQDQEQSQEIELLTPAENEPHTPAKREDEQPSLFDYVELDEPVRSPDFNIDLVNEALTTANLPFPYELSLEYGQLKLFDTSNAPIIRTGKATLELETKEFTPSPVLQEDYHEVIHQAFLSGFSINQINDQEQQADEKQKAYFSFPDDTIDFYPSMRKFKIAGNLEALRLLRELEQENRQATPYEQEILGKYVGWGGLADIFDETKENYAEARNVLSRLVSDSEFQSMRESVLTAYYTDPDLIRAVYNKIESLGFSQGRILDPAMGTGNFYSAMPADMYEKSELHGVELDPITGRIAQYLHPGAKIKIQGFETTRYSPGEFDLIVGNIPFNDFKISSEQYPKRYLIHDYFMKRSLDLLKEGGLFAVFTSTGSMNKLNGITEEIHKEADLVGGLRLPNNAFKRIAGTETVVDLLVFQKNTTKKLSTTPDWAFQTGINVNGTSAIWNNYFVHHPKQVLGNLAVKNYFGGMVTVTAFEDSDLLKDVTEGLTRFNPLQLPLPEPGKETAIVLDSTQVNKNQPSIDTDTIPLFTYFIDNEVIFYRTGDGIRSENLTGTAERRLTGMIRLREQVQAIIALQLEPDYSLDYFEEKLAVLNADYDTFVRDYGALSSDTNTRLFYEDDYSPLLQSIEVKTTEGGYVKSEFFSQPTVKPILEITSVDTAQEALTISLNKRQFVDFDYMRSLYPVSEEQLIEELGTSIYINPEKYETMTNYWESQDEYLTGDVKAKLEMARVYAMNEPELFNRNIAALEKVIPADLVSSEIDMSLGATWIPLDIYKQFMFEVFETPWTHQNTVIQLEYNPLNSSWFIPNKGRLTDAIVTSNFGTERANAYVLMEDSLNLRKTIVRDPNPYGDSPKYLVNQVETQVARIKQEELFLRFETWIEETPAIKEQLTNLYNDRFNRLRPREYDGTSLTFDSLNPMYDLRPHQRNVVARILQNGKALMAHEVGAGKTLSMITAGMLLKEQGLIKKPLYVVPSHLTTEFGQELLRFYPTKKVLITTKKDFEKKNRKAFVSRIATGEYDAIIMGHSQFKKVPLSDERVVAMLTKEIEDVTEAIRVQKIEDEKSWSLKQMELFKKQRQQQLTDLYNRKDKDDILTFEELGVDFLFADESHVYKNLKTYTKLSNVAGVNNSGSQQATDMYMKTQYMLQEHDGRGVVFATGTPISNSMSELYTMQKYLQPELLEQMDVTHFDQWASTFGEIISSLEMTPDSSTYQIKNRFAKFHNIPELMAMFTSVADIQTADMLDLPTPEIATGKPQLVVTNPTVTQQQMMAEINERCEAIRLKEVAPEVDNMLKITNEAKLLALDPRLLDETLPAENDTKIGRCCEKVYSIYKKTEETSRTQIIFCDSGTPKKDKFNVYDEVKGQLIDKGIPKEEIAFIHDVKNEKQRDILFEKVRNGEVRILLGSTSKVGTGVNIQDRLIAAHHLDCPWRPSDLTQRDGRIVRQGNENSEVEIFRYVTKGTFDAYSWQIQEQKVRYISQIMSGRSAARSADDLTPLEINANEAKQLANNNPAMAEKLNVDQELMGLRMAKTSWEKTYVKIKRQVEELWPAKITSLTNLVERQRKDLTALQHFPTDFEMIIDGVTYLDRTDATKGLAQKFDTLGFQDSPISIGSFNGLDFRCQLKKDGTGVAVLVGEAHYSVDLNAGSPTGSLTRIVNVIDKLPERVEDNQKEIDSMSVDMEKGQRSLGEPFSQEDRLRYLTKRQTELQREIEEQLVKKEAPIQNLEPEMER